MNPVKHYKLDVGLLQEGDKADFIEIDNFEELNILKTVIGGFVVCKDGWSLIPTVRTGCINNFKIKPKKIEDFSVKSSGKKINVIEVIDGQLITKKILVEPRLKTALLFLMWSGIFLKLLL